MNVQNMKKEELDAIPTSKLVEIYNHLARKVDQREVERFAKREDAVRRTWGMILNAQQLGKEIDAPTTKVEAPKAKKAAKPEAKEEAKPKAKAEVKKEANAKAAKEPKTDRRSPKDLEGKKLYFTGKDGVNPRRDGTWGFKSLQIIISNPGIKFEDWVKKGGRTVDLYWDMKYDRIEVK